MKRLIYSLLLITPSIFSCQQRIKTFPNLAVSKDQIFVLDTALKDTIQRHIKLHLNKHFASFETPAEIRFFSDRSLVDSVIESNFRMVSWYSNHNDTIDLVAHVGEFETQALLVRFIHGERPRVFYFRAPHERQRYFRLKKTDSFTNQLEVLPVSYKLEISVIPDTIQKPLVFGKIDMESGEYFDRRDSLKREKVQMKFYFVSQFRQFD